MSFSNNCKPDKMPGVIKGNPLLGLCDRTVIETKKVFDACMRQEAVDNLSATIQVIEPAGLVAPYTFVSARNSSVYADFDSLIITEMPGDSCLSRVQGIVRIPIQITLTDSNGTPGVALAILSVNRDVVLNVPQQSIMPFAIEAVASFTGSSGYFNGTTQAILSGCLTIVLKVTMPVELLVPTYGYAFIPPCQEFSEEVCEGVFDIPLYPCDCD